MGRLTASVVAFVAAAPAWAVDVAVTYTGPVGGAWNVASNWTPAVVPQNDAATFYFVTIPRAGVVALGSGATVSGVTVDGGGEIRIGNGIPLTLAGPDLHVDGGILLNGSGSAQSRIVVGVPELTLSGTGAVTTSAGSGNRIIGTGGTRTLVIEPTIEVIGSLTLGNNTLRVVNSGLVESSGASGITIDTAGTASANHGTIRAGAGSPLNINASTFVASGLFESSSSMFIRNSSIFGGTFASTNGGVFRIPGTTSPNESILDGIHSTGEIQVTDYGRLILRNGIVNDGTLRISSPGGGMTTILVDAPSTVVSGRGLLLSDHLEHTITGAAGTESIEFESGQVLRGAFTISNLVLVNHGLIEADSAAGIFITGLGTASTPGSGGAHHGIIRAATANGQPVLVRINSASLDAQDGLFEADGGELRVTGSSVIVGGTYRALNGGTILLGETGAGTMPRLVDAVLESPVRVEGWLSLAGTIENQEEIQVGGTLLTAAPGTVIQGSGVLRRPDPGTVGGLATANAGAPLELGPDLTVLGPINIIGEAITNHALIDAGPGETLLTWNSGPVLPSANDGVIRAGAGATVKLGGTFDNAGGLIAADGGAVDLNASVTGGILRQANGGTLRLRGMVEDALIEGNATAQAGDWCGIGGDIHMDGVLQLTGGNTQLRLKQTAGASLSGSGRIAFTQAGNNAVNWYPGGPGLPLEIGPEFTLEGPFNASVPLINHGTVAAPGGANTTFLSGATISNDGLLVARTGGRLYVYDSSVLSSTGIIRAEAGGTFDRSGNLLRIDAGRLEIEGTARAGASNEFPRTFELDDEGVVTGGGTIVCSAAWFLGGSLQPGSPLAPLTITGSAIFGDGARWDAGPVGANDYSRLSVSGVALLGGTLAIDRPHFAPGEQELEIEILSASIVFGRFDAIETCEAVEVVYGGASVTLRFTNGPAGDLNGDLDVDGDDLGTLLGDWGPCSDPCCGSDLNGDGEVGEVDLAILLANWTSRVGPKG